MKWLAILALALSACTHEPPEQAAAREAITKCREKQSDVDLTLMQLYDQRQTCDRMRAAYAAKWGR